VAAILMIFLRIDLPKYKTVHSQGVVCHTARLQALACLNQLSIAIRSPRRRHDLCGLSYWLFFSYSYFYFSVNLYSYSLTDWHRTSANRFRSACKTKMANSTNINSLTKSFIISVLNSLVWTVVVCSASWTHAVPCWHTKMWKQTQAENNRKRLATAGDSCLCAMRY